MRVGHYMHDLWSPGGVATYLERITAAQDRLGHEVVYFDSAPASDPRATRVADGDELVAAARRSAVDVLHLHIDPPGGFPGGVPAVRTVHGHQPYCPSGTQFLAAHGKPCERSHGSVVCTWGHLVDRCGSARPLRLIGDLRRTAAERRCPPTVTLIAPSRFVHRRLMRAGYDGRRIKVLTNPAPPVEAAGPFADEARFLFLGRIVPPKGATCLVEAAGAARCRWHVDIAGIGYAEADVRALVAARGLTDRVTFHGWLDAPAVAELVRQAWAVVMPSVWHEPAGLSAIEAGAFGRAVVASDAGGLPEVVQDGVTGRLVPPADVRRLAEVLDGLSADPDGAAAMGRAGADRIRRRHSLTDHLSALHRLYAETIGQ